MNRHIWKELACFGFAVAVIGHAAAPLSPYVQMPGAKPKMEDCRGRVAGIRGPVVYCHERRPDQPAVSLPMDVRLMPHRENGLVVLRGDGFTVIPHSTGPIAVLRRWKLGFGRDDKRDRFCLLRSRQF